MSDRGFSASKARGSDDPSARRHVLVPGRVEVWTATDESVSDSRLRELYELLSTQERANAARYTSTEDRNRYILAHACLRQVLSLYAHERPEALAFVSTGSGRPMLANAPSGRAVFFSLSHTRGLVAVAVSAMPEVGIDVENVQVRADLRGMSEEVLHPAEQRSLVGKTEDEFRWGFLTFWTLKEAYLKARGTGISVALHSLRFLVEGEIRLRPCDVLSANGDAEELWTFLCDRPTACHQLAVAAGTPDAHVIFHRLALNKDARGE